MKSIRLYLTTLAAVFMAACSSMEVDDDELYVENFPKDFADTVYMNLHPELASIQIKQYVKDHNESLKASMDEAAYQKMYDEDTTAFSKDTAALHEIFVTPTYVGFSEEDWVDAWAPITTYDVTCNVNRTFKEIFLIIGKEKKDTTKVFVDSVKLDTDGNFTKVYGKPAALTAPSKQFDVNDTVVFFNKGAVYDSVEVCDSLAVVKEGELSAVHKSLVVNFNLYDVSDDIAALKKIPLDIKAIAYQYIMYGKLHGWTYRRCKADEKKNPIRPVMGVDDTTSKLYCDDNGVAREIR